MTNEKIHPPLIRALARTGLYRWAYCDAEGNVTMDHLIEHGIDAYAARNKGGIMRSACVDIGRTIVQQHADAFKSVLVDALNHGAKFGGPAATADAFCQLFAECDDRTLAWWCAEKLGPAMEAVLGAEVQP